MIHYIALFIFSVFSLAYIWYKELHFDRRYILFKKKYGIFFGWFIYAFSYWALFEMSFWFWWLIKS